MSGTQAASSADTTEDILLEKEAASAQQSAEWGIQALQSSFLD